MNPLIASAVIRPVHLSERETDSDPRHHLGLNAAIAEHLSTRLPPEGGPCELMRLTEVHRETVQLHDGIQPYEARAEPRLLRRLLDAESGLAVGDWAWTRRDAHGALWLIERMPPLTRIVRRDADGTRHPVVSNVDTVLLVMGLDDDFNLRRLERYLALVHGSGVRPVVVLTKADVLSFREAAERMAELRARLPPGLPVHAVNGLDDSAREALQGYLQPGCTLVLMGSSGAGKSTLTNTLIGQAVQDTGAVREHDSRGKHTTTARSLHRVPGGACVIDTPGLRTLRPDVDERTLAGLFGDIASASMQCRFRNCRHGDEPGCAVRDAVDPDRLNNFHKLQREARRDTMSALERQQQLQQWKARGREGRTRLKIKRGEA